MSSINKLSGKLSALSRAKASRDARLNRQLDATSTVRERFNLIYTYIQAHGFGTLRLNEHALVTSLTSGRRTSRITSYDPVTGRIEFLNHILGDPRTKQTTVYEANANDLKFVRREKPAVHLQYSYIFQGDVIKVTERPNADHDRRLKVKRKP